MTIQDDIHVATLRHNSGNNELRGHLCMFLACAFWGLMAPLGKEAMTHGISGLTMVTFRVCGAALLFWTASLFAKKEHVPLRHRFMFAGAAVFGLILNQCGYTIGLSITSPVNASIVTTSMPIFAMVLSALILKEPLTAKKAGGVAIGCCGAVMLILTSASAASAQVGDIRGDLMCMGAQFSYALYLSLFNSLIKRYSVITVNKWMFLWAALIITPFSLGHVMQTQWDAITFGTWMETAYVVCVGTFAAYILCIAGQRVLRPTVVSAYNYVQPAVSVIVSVCAGIAILKPTHALALALVIAGVWMINRSRAKSPKNQTRKTYTDMKTHTILLVSALLAGNAMAQDKEPLPPLADSCFYDGYRLAWSDEFETDGRPATHWSYEQGFVRNEELQWYQPQNAHVEGGCLVIEGKREAVPNHAYDPDSRDWRKNRPQADYTSACVITKGSFEFRYGRLEVRARIPVSGGAWPAIWTLGNQWPWPDNGEVDLLEHYLVDGRQTILANAAWGDSKPWTAVWSTTHTPLTHFTDRDPQWVDKFHVWRMDWDKDFIRLYLDDEMLNEVDLSKTRNRGNKGNTHNPFSNDVEGFGQYILLNLALGGNGGTPDDSAFPLKMEVDYVRYFEPVR